MGWPGRCPLSKDQKEGATFQLTGRTLSELHLLLVLNCGLENRRYWKEKVNFNFQEKQTIQPLSVLAT